MTGHVNAEIVGGPYCGDEVLLPDWQWQYREKHRGACHRWDRIDREDGTTVLWHNQIVVPKHKQAKGRRPA